MASLLFIRTCCGMTADIFSKRSAKNDTARSAAILILFRTMFPNPSKRRSADYIIRGEFAQGKLCKVLSGKVMDVAVDIRFGSPTFGKYFATELSEENSAQLWIPPGFAHGFSVLSEKAVFHYKCTNYYSKEHERAIRFNDPFLNIQWQVKNPNVSQKDLAAPLFSEIEKDFIIS